MDLQIDTSGAYAVALLSGEIRSEDATGFVEALHPLVAESGARLAIDLSGVEWLDSTGLTSLINVATRARLSQARVVFVAPTPFVTGVLEVTNLDKWFEIAPDHDTAARILKDGA
jgi:anti-anti-sigma factor